MFIPAYSSSNRRVAEIVYLYEGYVFARVPHLSCLDGSPYIESILSLDYSGGHVRAATVKDAEIQQIRRQLRSLVPCYSVGSRVTITRGVYSNITGVVTVDPERDIQSKVRDILVDGVPRSCKDIADLGDLIPAQVNTPLQKFKHRGLVKKVPSHQWQWIGDPPEDIAVHLDFDTFSRTIRVPLLFVEAHGDP